MEKRKLEGEELDLAREIACVEAGGAYEYWDPDAIACGTEEDPRLFGTNMAYAAPTAAAIHDLRDKNAFLSKRVEELEDHMSALQDRVRDLAEQLHMDRPRSSVDFATSPTETVELGGRERTYTIDELRLLGIIK